MKKPELYSGNHLGTDNNIVVDGLLWQYRHMVCNCPLERAHFKDFDASRKQNIYVIIIELLDQNLTCRFTNKTGSVIGHTVCELSENTSKSYSGILISNKYDHLPHLTYLDILSNQQKTPKYIIKKKQDEASLLSFSNEIKISLRNTHFPTWTSNRSKCDMKIY